MSNNKIPRGVTLKYDTYITYVPPRPDDDASFNAWYNGPGWYFQDETGMLNGPFDTKYDASVAFGVYVEGMG